MAQPSLSGLVARIWEETLRESEDPFRDARGFLNSLLGVPPVLHRDYLDRIRINYYGEPIPRIVVVRQNLRRLGNIRLNPKRLPQ